MPNRINKFVLNLYRMIEEIPVELFKEAVFERIKPIISFDSGAWIDGRSDKLLLPHAIYLYNQPYEMMENYQRINAKDTLRLSAQQNPGQSIDLFSIENKRTWRNSEVFNEHCSPYGMETGACTAWYEQDLGLFSFISLYRSDLNHPFSEHDLRTKELLIPHIIEAYRLAAILSVKSDAIGSINRQALAIVDQQGLIHQASDNFAAIIRDNWKDWSGPRLPNELYSPLIKEEKIHIHNYSFSLRLMRHDFFLLIVSRVESWGLLTPAEQRVAKYLSEGLSYKETARELDLSPSTVTNHANQIYKKLGVSSKAELIHRLVS